MDNPYSQSVNLLKAWRDTCLTIRDLEEFAQANYDLELMKRRSNIWELTNRLSRMFTINHEQ